MNPQDIVKAINMLCEEKGLPKDAVSSTIEMALAAAYRKDFGSKQQNIRVNLNSDTAEFEVYDIKTVVETEKDEDPESEDELVRFTNKEGEEEIRKFNPKVDITLEEAKKIDDTSEIGSEIKTKLEVPGDFGRMAAQTAKQVIIQRLREAERDTIFKEFKGREGEIISGIVHRVEGRTVIIDLGRTTGILPLFEQIRGETYRTGARIKLLILEVKSTPKGPEVILSRVNSKIVEHLFETEVPEIASGAVEIKAIAREAGSRTKIAVVAHEENIDPIGSCVGQRGTRVQTIMNELGGEKIDIIEYKEDIKDFLAQALSPAKIHHVDIIDEKEKRAKVHVKELSLAIGKGGQNVRLAAKLTGWKIDIVELGNEEIVEFDSAEPGDAEVVEKEEGGIEVKDKEKAESDAEEEPDEKQEEPESEEKKDEPSVDEQKSEENGSEDVLAPAEDATEGEPELSGEAAEDKK